MTVRTSVATLSWFAAYQIGVMEAIVRDYEGHVAAAAGQLAVLPGAGTSL